METNSQPGLRLGRVIPSTETCPVAGLAEIVSPRWTVDVLLLLGSAETPLRFNEILQKLRPISSKVLVQRLRELERDGFLAHEYYAEMPPRSEYSLTPMGLSLWPVLEQILVWMDANQGEIESSQAEYDQSGKRRPA